jgi:hypothetical protein
VVGKELEGQRQCAWRYVRNYEPRRTGLQAATARPH